jgi:hypothetical protein
MSEVLKPLSYVDESFATVSAQDVWDLVFATIRNFGRVIHDIDSPQGDSNAPSPLTGDPWSLAAREVQNCS